jgi:Glycosyltransferase like family 2
VTRFLAPAGVEPSGSVKPPTFAVIVPAYQSASTVGAALDSALGQTHPATEIIVCDDGSTDDLDGALAPYLDRIVLVRQEHSGISAARNRAIATARSDFIVSLDADDVLAPGNLAASAELLSLRPDLDIVCTNANVEFDGTVVRQMYRDDWRFEIADQRAAILRRCYIAFWCARRSRLLEVGGFDEAIASAEDWELWIRMILSGSRAGLVDEPLATYRLHHGSLSTQSVRLHTGRLATMEKTIASGQLSEDELAAMRALRDNEAFELSVARVRQAVLDRSPTARRESRRLLFASGMRLDIRLRAALSWVSPALARRVLARRGQQTAGAVTLPND